MNTFILCLLVSCFFAVTMADDFFELCDQFGAIQTACEDLEQGIQYHLDLPAAYSHIEDHVCPNLEIIRLDCNYNYFYYGGYEIPE